MQTGRTVDQLYGDSRTSKTNNQSNETKIHKFAREGGVKLSLRWVETRRYREEGVGLWTAKDMRGWGSAGCPARRRCKLGGWRRHRLNSGPSS